MLKPTLAGKSKLDRTSAAQITETSKATDELHTNVMTLSTELVKQAKEAFE